MAHDDLGAVLAALLRRSQQTPPDGLSALFDATARVLGLAGARVLLADVQQLRLVPLGTGGTEADGPLGVDGTVAGRAYRTMTAHTARDEDGTVRLWLPLMDGIERIGVLEVGAHRDDPELLDRCRALADVAALAVISKSGFSDGVVRTVRSAPMTLAAELVWSFLPPRTVGTDRVTSSAVLEPAYEVGGDAFDQALHGEQLHLAVVDAMGHDLASGLSAAVALAGCRSARRAGGRLPAVVDTVDEALARWIPDRLLTAVVGTLDLGTGRFAWLNCGHPPPLLIRRQHVVAGALEHPGELPLGLGPAAPGSHRTVHSVQLEPGDRILVHTDGVTEARAADGTRFGEERLIDHVVRAAAAGEPAPEALRRLINAIMERQRGRLDDDATILLVEWHPPTAEAAEPAESQDASSRRTDAT
ncbi:PP2C family protein-serine/threonine phosphatase [Kitasatospora sp. NPDC059571]|uniref:PP2C family protein-serine/threonine phosphatase n=1 Tax=Kitasatospora sp. NPDC059571 TaxID=3346871 RepID=UPI0036AC72B3